MVTKKDRYLTVGLKGIAVGPGPFGSVLVEFEFPQGAEDVTGLAPGIGLLVEMSPTEVRQLAEALVRALAAVGRK